MKKAIVLAHGLFMKKQVMFFLKKSFELKGFKVYNFGYNTRTFNRQTLIEFDKFVKEIPEKKVYFIGHSMGGLLMRLYLEEWKPEFKDSCLITLGTPHKGSSLGRFVEDTPFKFVLGTAQNSGVTNGLGWWKGDYPLGCIVGLINFGPNNILNKKPLNGDGTVLKCEAFPDNATDIKELMVSHTAMVYSPKVVKECLYFIKKKKFKQ